jgi:glycosyltransferase involved in cell wall biosynthesis
MSLSLGVLTTSYPRFPGDPAGRFVAELCGWLAAQGDRVEVLAPSPATSEHRGVTVRGLRYAVSPRLLYGAGAPDNLRTLRAKVQVPALVSRMALSCRLRSRGWQRILSHWLLPCGLAAARFGRGLPHLAVAHSSDVHLLARLPVGGLLLRGLARERTGLVLTSESLRLPLLRLAHTEATRSLVTSAPAVRMGIEAARLLTPDAVLRARARRRLDVDGRLVLLALGRLVPVKGIDLLIRAVAPLGERLLAVVVGDGPERERLARLASELDAPVRLVGEQTGADRDAWLRAADVFAAPSVELPDGRSDSAPVALLEALAAGLPVVASDVGGNAALLEGAGARKQNAGLVVDGGALGPLRQAITRLAGDAALRGQLAAAGRIVAARHTWDRVGARLRALLLAL